MKCLSPVLYRDADTLRPSDVRKTLEHFQRNLDALERRRWSYSSFTIDFRDLQTSDDATEGEFEVQPPSALGPWEIVGLEWRVAAASGDHVLSINVDGTPTETMTVTATSATAFVAHQKATNIQVGAGEAVGFIATGFASVVVASAQLTVHIRSDRLGGSAPATFAMPTIQDGAVFDGDALATAISQYEADMDTHAAALTALRIEVHGIRNVSGTNPAARTFDIPATASKLHSFGSYLLQTSGAGHETLFRVTDTDTATNYDVTVAGDGVTSIINDVETSVAATQANDDPDDTADHWTATIDPAGTSTVVPRAYLVLYWEE